MSLVRPPGPSPWLLALSQEECGSVEEAARVLFERKTPGLTGTVNPEQICKIFSTLRLGGVSLNQVRAAVGRVCAESPDCAREEFLDLLRELDRRYSILQAAQWEFVFLDREKVGSIVEQDALFLFKAAHRECFLLGTWQSFLEGRQYPGTRVTWREIEVPLCEIPDWAEVETRRVEELCVARERELEEEERRREREEAEQQAREETRERERAQQEAKALAEQLVREKTERERSQEERRRREEEEERQREEERWREEEARKVEEECLKRETEREKREEEEETQLAAERERETERLVREAEERARQADTEAARIAAEGAREQALLRARRERHTRLKTELQKAIRLEEIAQLEPAIQAVKRERVEKCQELLAEAERLLGKLRAAKGLRGAVLSRQLATLEGAVEVVRRGGWEGELEREVGEARALIEKLKQLEQMKKAVLDLSQRVVAEIKSYQKPPLVVHTVMRTTFLLLGNTERETKSWQATQILIGQTGKRSLKRRVLECSVDHIPRQTALGALEMLKSFDFAMVEEASVGCAVFYAWAEGVIEEVLQRHS